MQCRRRIIHGNLIGHAPHMPAALCAGIALCHSTPAKSMPSLEREDAPCLKDACLPQQPCSTCQKHSYLTFKSVCKHSYPRWWAKWVCTSAANLGYRGLGQRHATQYQGGVLLAPSSTWPTSCVHPVKVTLCSQTRFAPRSFSRVLLNPLQLKSHPVPAVRSIPRPAFSLSDNCPFRPHQPDVPRSKDTLLYEWM